MAELVAARSAIHAEKARYYLPLDDGGEMVYCTVERHSGSRITAYHLHREDTGAFLLAASCDSETEGEFKFHTLADSHLRAMKDIPAERDSAVFLGSMTLNYLGTEFVLKDHRGDRCETMVNELALVVYEPNMTGRSPNAMKALIPRYVFDADLLRLQCASISERYATLASTKLRGSYTQALMRKHFPRTAHLLGNSASSGKRAAVEKVSVGASIAQAPAEFRHEARAPAEPSAVPVTPTSAEDDEAVDYSAVEGDDQYDLAMFVTKKPVWNDDIGAWTLNFNGRAKRASKKNFLLIQSTVSQKDQSMGEADAQASKIFLRFGKMSKSRFSLDFRDPFSPVVALAVALTTFAKKRVVT